ncbi:MAG: hypothetical protein ABJA77_18650 [Variovorax sp.]
MCANISQAKGRVVRANLTLQDRLVKELRLREINTREAANAFAPHFIADFNARFAKLAKRDFDAHRPVRADENLDLIFTWRLQRKVSLSLTLQHERVIYLLKDPPANRKLIHRYIDVYEYPDGRMVDAIGNEILAEIYRVNSLHVRRGAGSNDVPHRAVQTPCFGGHAACRRIARRVAISFEAPLLVFAGLWAEEPRLHSCSGPPLPATAEHWLMESALAHAVAIASS